MFFLVFFSPFAHRYVIIFAFFVSLSLSCSPLNEKRDEEGRESCFVCVMSLTGLLLRQSRTTEALKDDGTRRRCLSLSLSCARRTNVRHLYQSLYSDYAFFTTTTTFCQNPKKKQAEEAGKRAKAAKASSR